MDWIPLDIVTPAERDAVCLALFHAGYTVRQRKRKDGNKTVIVVENNRPCQCGDYVFLPYPHLNVWGNKVDESLEEDHFIPVELFDVKMVEKIVQHRPHALMGGEIESFQKKEVPKFIQHLSECFPELFEEYKMEHPEQEEHIAAVSQDHVGRKAYLRTMKDGASFYDRHRNLWTKKEGFIVCERCSTWIYFPAGKKPRKCMQELTDDIVVEVSSNDFVSAETKFAD